MASHLDRVYADLYDPDTNLDEQDPTRGWAFLRKLVHLPILVPQIPDAEMFRIVDLITGVQTVTATTVFTTESDRTRPRRPADPQLQALMRKRLAAQPDRSIREATRHLNVWDFYERVLATTEPIDDDATARLRSQHLIILAEIVTRWPALQRFLHRRTSTHTGLQLLAAAAQHDNDQAWNNAANTVLPGHDTSDETLTALRQLLRDHNGTAVADLAIQLL